jgi:hypothetical protein
VFFFALAIVLVVVGISSWFATIWVPDYLSHRFAYSAVASFACALVCLVIAGAADNNLEGR